MIWINAAVNCFFYKIIKATRQDFGNLGCDVRVKDKRRIEAGGKMPNGVRVIFFLNVLTLHSHHHKHIKPL